MSTTTPALRRTIFTLAAALSHGWTRHTTDQEVADTDWDDLVEIVSARMDAAEAEPDAWQGSEGLRPSLTHTSGSGRYSWTVHESRHNGEATPVVRVRVSRPGAHIERDVIEGVVQPRSAYDRGQHGIIEARHVRMLASLLRDAGLLPADILEDLTAGPLLGVEPGDFVEDGWAVMAAPDYLGNGAPDRRAVVVGPGDSAAVYRSAWDRAVLDLPFGVAQAISRVCDRGAFPPRHGDARNDETEIVHRTYADEE